MDKILEVKNSFATFNGFDSVNSISFSIEKGDMPGLVAPNGAGKTSAIKILTTLIPPTSGEAFLFTLNPPKKASKKNNSICFTASFCKCISNRYENLLVCAKLYDITSVEREKRIKGSLNFRVDL